MKKIKVLTSFRNVFLTLTLVSVILFGCIHKEKKIENSEKDLLNQKANEFWESGWKKERNQDYSGAINDYTRSIEIRPNNGGMYANRASVRFDSGDYTGAINDYTKALEVEPGDVSLSRRVYHNRGIAKFYLIDFRGAIVDFDKVLISNPENPLEKEAQMWIYYYRGLSKINLGQKDSGCLDLSKSGELGLAKAYDVIREYCN